MTQALFSTGPRVPGAAAFVDELFLAHIRVPVSLDATPAAHGLDSGPVFAARNAVRQRPASLRPMKTI